MMMMKRNVGEGLYIGGEKGTCRINDEKGNACGDVTENEIITLNSYHNFKILV